jgi:hypothetical protein
LVTSQQQAPEPQSATTTGMDSDDTTIKSGKSPSIRPGVL